MSSCCLFCRASFPKNRNPKTWTPTRRLELAAELSELRACLCDCTVMPPTSRCLPVIQARSASVVSPPH
jgi:hypothetical protein